MRLPRHHRRALGEAGLPAAIRCAGRAYHRERVYKHNVVSAVGLYRCGRDRLVLKCYRTAPLFLLPAEWGGRLMARHEVAALRRVQDIRGVPRLRGRLGATGIVRDYVPGRPLHKGTSVSEAFFPELFRMLRQMHRRGVAYVDLEKAENILVGEEGLPHLIDFQVAFRLPDARWRDVWPAGWLFELFRQADLYHARKHFRRAYKSSLGPRQKHFLRRKPWFVVLSNALHSPFKTIRRRLVGK